MGFLVRDVTIVFTDGDLFNTSLDRDYVDNDYIYDDDSWDCG